MARIKYERAYDIQILVRKIARKLEMTYIEQGNVVCFRSSGSRAKGTIARCWALPVILQQALNTKPCYAIEVIGERFDKLSQNEKEKVIIHEMLHIPKAFGGGLKMHGYVDNKRISEAFKKWKYL
ncbi:unnamed protein product [marine sediment metagenome]|uniref:Putative phage metallopeptidase domain-containing protein n=1 Tax=marine sediment metagenome TaxID=412755 RepID=X1NYI1_9ZZZZ